MSSLHDRELSLLGGHRAFADLASVLSSSTRTAVLAALLRDGGSVHIQELGRRVGVDASPVRTHLEVLLRGGLVEEVAGRTGRERRFRATVKDARLVLVDAHRVLPEETELKELPKDAAKLKKKLDSLAKKRDQLDAEAAKLRREMERALTKEEEES